MSDLTNLFVVIIIVQLFFSFAVTGVAYAVPDDTKDYVTSFSSFGSDLSIEGVGASIEDSLVSQTKIPVIDLGALVFYSGNIIIDLLLNFAFAIPQMFTLLINGLMSLFGFDVVIFNLIQLVLSVMIVSLYFFGLIRLVTGIRSGRLV